MPFTRRLRAVYAPFTRHLRAFSSTFSALYKPRALFWPPQARGPGEVRGRGRSPSEEKKCRFCPQDGPISKRPFWQLSAAVARAGNEQKIADARCATVSCCLPELSCCSATPPTDIRHLGCGQRGSRQVGFQMSMYDCLAAPYRPLDAHWAWPGCSKIFQVE